MKKVISSPFGDTIINDICKKTCGICVGGSSDNSVNESSDNKITSNTNTESNSEQDSSTGSNSKQDSSTSGTSTSYSRALRARVRNAEGTDDARGTATHGGGPNK